VRAARSWHEPQASGFIDASSVRPCGRGFEPRPQGLRKRRSMMMKLEVLNVALEAIDCSGLS
jgi:hypothetical protein